ncbi:MAG: PorT family protein [Bacteroidetes bacterium]|nr:PorT family protein [Bacteroidota bacterium]
MKKLVLISLISLTSLSLYAQKNGVGIKAGLSSTQVDFEGEQLVPNGAQMGYHVGVFARFGGIGFFVQPEVLFTQTSGRFKLELPPVSSISPPQYEAKFNRLDVPVMAGFRMLKIVRIMAGPIASFNIDSSLKDAGTTVQNIDFKKATLGYQTGVGIDLGNLTFEGKYEGGLSRFTENVGSYTADNRLNQWVLSVGIKLF